MESKKAAENARVSHEIKISRLNELSLAYEESTNDNPESIVVENRNGKPISKYLQFFKGRKQKRDLMDAKPAALNNLRKKIKTSKSISDDNFSKLES